MPVRRVLLVVLLALCGALEGVSPAPVPAGGVVEYTLEETFRFGTPRGERAGGASGRVTILDGKALWQLDSGRFPRSEVSAVLSEGGTVTLMDRMGKAYAEAPWADFSRLFGDPAAPDPGQSAALVRDLEVSLRATGASAPFDGRKTTQHVLHVKYALVVSSPGRSATVTHELRASITIASGLDDARSPFDDPSRLFPLRGAPLEAVEAEMAKLDGWPVSVRIESEAVWTSEPVGTAREPAAAPLRPLRSSAAVTRTVTNLARRPEAEGDAGRLRVPGDYRSRPFEKMILEGSGLERR
jgi:hypothetical protein